MHPNDILEVIIMLFLMVNLVFIQKQKVIVTLICKLLIEPYNIALETGKDAVWFEMLSLKVNRKPE